MAAQAAHARFQEAVQAEVQLLDALDEGIRTAGAAYQDGTSGSTAGY